MAASVVDEERVRHGSPWLWMVIAVPPLAALLTTLLAPDPSGHWSEHLGSAVLKDAQFALLVVLVSMLGRRTLGPLLLLALALTTVGIVFEAMGDHQVAQSIWRKPGDPGFGSGYELGHDRAALGDVLVLAGGALFAVIAGVTRRVPPWLAVAAVVLAIIPPPFLWPAFGIVILLLYGLATEAGWDAGRSVHRAGHRPPAQPGLSQSGDARR